MNRLPITEKEFQEFVIDLARRTGWLIHHDLPARAPSGALITNVQGHKGFPDLVLAHPTRGVLFVELKARQGRLSPEQVQWIDTINAGLVARDPYAAVWRPEDQPRVIRALTDGERP